MIAAACRDRGTPYQRPRPRPRRPPCRLAASPPPPPLQVHAALLLYCMLLGSSSDRPAAYRKACGAIAAIFVLEAVLKILDAGLNPKH